VSERQIKKKYGDSHSVRMFHELLNLSMFSECERGRLITQSRQESRSLSVELSLTWRSFKNGK